MCSLKRLRRFGIKRGRGPDEAWSGAVGPVIARELKGSQSISRHIHAVDPSVVHASQNLHNRDFDQEAPNFPSIPLDLTSAWQMLASAQIIPPHRSDLLHGAS